MKANSKQPKLRVNGATKVYNTRSGDLLAIDRCSLDIMDGEIVCIVGPSGCGKTTLLWSMSGLHGLSAGEVLLDGKPVTGPNPEIGMVFQDANLLPWRNLDANINFPFEIKGTKPDRVWIDELAEPRRARGLRRPLSTRTVGRHAAARGAGAGAFLQAVGSPDGRALRGARRLYPRGDEPAGRGNLARHQDHHRPHHPFDRRGDLPGAIASW